MYLNELFGLKNKVAVVTGGSKGLGQAVAIGLAKAGAEVVILSRSEADETITEIEKIGGSAYHIPTDVTVEDQVRNAVDEIVKRSGGIHVLFNNAGITLHEPALEASYEDYKKIIDTNMNGEYLVACIVAKSMVECGIKGSIINMASMSGTIVNVPNYQCAYNMSKAGIIHMTHSLAVEWIEYGIRVNSISPGYFLTRLSLDVPEELQETWLKMIPAGRMGDPDELIPAILYLASDAAGYTTGSNLIIDGGYSLI
jgi:sorbose reductase